MVILDEVDRKILFELDIDARASFSQIGKKLKIGKNNVQYRVKKLVQDGVIKKFVVQPSIAKLGFFLGKIYIQLAGCTNKERAEIFQYLADDRQICWVASGEGRWDLLFGAYVRSISHFAGIKDGFFKRFEKFVTSYDVVFLVEGYTSQRGYLINRKSVFKQKVPDFMGEPKVVSLSPQEQQILSLIANNARFNYMEISRKLKIDIKTAKKRIVDLERKGVIQGYVSFLEPKKFGYSLFKLCIYLKDYEAKKVEFINYCLENPNVIHVIDSMGPWEIELEMEVASIDEFYNLTHEIRNRYSQIIKKTESVFISSESKLDFLPMQM